MVEIVKEDLAEAYVNLLDTKKWGILGTGAEAGVNFNPLKDDAVKYLTADAAVEENTDIFSTMGKNIKKNLVEKMTWWTSLEYDKASLAKMKALIVQNKDNQTKLQELMTQIEAGTDPTLDATVVAATTTAVIQPSAETTSVTSDKSAWDVEKWEIARADFVYPVTDAKINSPIGSREIKGIPDHIHKWVDIAATEKTPILSIADGEVEDVWFGIRSFFSGYGNFMVVKLTNGDRVLYGHMHKRAQKADGTKWKKWDKITSWEQVWLMWSTWMSTGSHLHLEIRTWTPDDTVNFFSREYKDPIEVLPVTKDMVDADILDKIDETKLMAA